MQSVTNHRVDNQWIHRAIFGILIPLGALLALSFLMVLTYLGLKIESPNLPALFLQKRIGKGGREFILYKYRTMQRGIKAPGPCRLVRDERTDPRITPLGRFLRRTKLDETPQLFNILRGDMSLVGPRPMGRPEHNIRVKETPGYIERNVVDPGIAGYAALFGPERNLPRDYLDQLDLDRYYLEHRSILFDLWILYKTVELVIFGRKPEVPQLAFEQLPAAE